LTPLAFAWRAFDTSVNVVQLVPMAVTAVMRPRRCGDQAILMAVAPDLSFRKREQT
jgi:hypothetical protein